MKQSRRRGLLNHVGTLTQIGLPGPCARDTTRYLTGFPTRWLTLACVLGACGGESKNNDAADTSSAAGGNGGSGAGGATSATTTSSATTGGRANSSGGKTPSTSSAKSGSGSGSGGASSSASSNSASDGNVGAGGSGGLAGMSSMSSANTSAGGSGGFAGMSSTSSSTNTGAGGSGGMFQACEAQDVAAVGVCDAAFGVFFLGAGCGWLSGCSCEGADCDSAYADLASCQMANRGCLADCMPQDATSLGTCEPVPHYVFNGVECVPMEGCSCVGDECDIRYAATDDQTGQQACEAAHAVCANRARSCEEIAALYDDYVSHTACSDDTDCAVVHGQCAIGIGGCHHVLNRHWGAAGISGLADMWLAAGCSGPVCDCAEPPTSATCDNGVCVAASE